MIDCLFSPFQNSKELVRHKYTHVIRVCRILTPHRHSASANVRTELFEQEAKYLGSFLDSGLTFRRHIGYATEKVYKARTTSLISCTLMRWRWAIKYYCTSTRQYINPSFCIQLWCGALAAKSFVQSSQTAENKTLRTTTKAHLVRPYHHHPT